LVYRAFYCNYILMHKTLYNISRRSTPSPFAHARGRPWSGEGVACWSRSTIEVNLRRARLVLGWVTVSSFNCRSGTFISICKQPPRLTRPGHPSLSTGAKYQPKGGDALRLGRKAVIIRFITQRMQPHTSQTTYTMQ